MSCVQSEIDGDSSRHCCCVPYLRAEVERLRVECHALQLWCEEAVEAENANAEAAREERAAVVASLRRTSNHGPMGLSLVNLDSIADAIERGEHRKEEP